MARGVARYARINPTVGYCQGMAYIGAVLATKDGLWPDASELPRIEKSLWEGTGCKLWEMCEVDNARCSDAPLDPYHETRLMPSLVARK